MLHYYKFRQELFAPAPGKEIYGKVAPGKGRPEECPPLRAANSFGYDVLANFDVTFVRDRRGDWRAEPDTTLASDFDYSPHDDDDVPGKPLTQQYAWFWERGQTIPHPISDDVYATIRNQVKISSFLFLKTDPNELLLVLDVPNQWRPWRAWAALLDTDWYPASYPWHAVLELSPKEKRITIRKGEPICRIVPVRRDTYFAQHMTPAQFDDFFARGQQWLAAHGRPHDADSGTMDITRTYAKQMIKSKFVVLG
jgi:antitoxin (DNA-binding transcriptional repressor) of toxin-antitoxin stability system